MTIAIEIRHRLELIALDLSFSLGHGVTALLGPSGAGKTSILNVIAGLMRADHAIIRIGDTVITDTTRGLWLPPNDRGIGYVFQESRLFPHFTVHQNLVYSWRVRRRAPDARRLAELIDLLDLGRLLARRSTDLSGGEQRRVALGRALLSDPRLLLLDEPLGSVDVDRRQEILPYLDRIMTEHQLPMVYVTHERAEIDGRAEMIVQINHGRASVLTTKRVGEKSL